MTTLADRLKSARKEAGLTQAELAKKAECSQGAIAHVESGTRLSMQNMATVAKILGVNAYWLETGKGPMRPETGLEGLSDAERELICFYRKMNGKDKQALHHIARGLTETEKTEEKITHKAA